MALIIRYRGGRRDLDGQKKNIFFSFLVKKIKRGLGFRSAQFGVDLGTERKTFCNSPQALSSKSDEQLAVEEA